MKNSQEKIRKKQNLRKILTKNIKEKNLSKKTIKFNVKI